MAEDFRQYGRTIRVEGGLKAQSARGQIGESWWSKRFLTVLESFAMGTRLTRGRSYARAGQVLSLTIAPGAVTSTVQGSRPQPYQVSITLTAYDNPMWTKVEQALGEQALFLARLLAGEMPQQIEDVFTAAGAPLFPTRADDLVMNCSCPDWGVPCKHLAATFYLLAEAFDADPFQILLWRGRDRDTLLSHLRRGRPKKHKEIEARPIGTAPALSEVVSAPLAESVSRFWVPPVPLPPRPPTLTTEVDLILRQLPTPDPLLGGTALVDDLRAMYAEFRPSQDPADR